MQSQTFFPDKIRVCAWVGGLPSGVVRPRVMVFLRVRMSLLFLLLGPELRTVWASPTSPGVPAPSHLPQAGDTCIIAKG